MARVKPYTLHGEPNVLTVEQIDEMLALLFEDLETSGYTPPDAENAAIQVGDGTDWTTLTPDTSGTFPRYDGADTTWAAVAESDITDGTLLARVADNESISGSWTFTATPTLNNAIYLSGKRAASLTSRLIGIDAADRIVIGDASSNLNNDVLVYYQGTLKLTIAADITISGSGTELRNTNGSAANPSYAFANSSDMGFYRDATVALALGVSVSGTLRSKWHSTSEAPAGGFWHNYAIEWAGVISPAALGTGANDNYNPTSLANAVTIRLTGDGSGTSTLGSIASPTAGRELRLINISTDNITITHAASTGTAANKFLLSGSADVVLGPNDSITLWYDTTSSRWREI